MLLDRRFKMDGKNKELIDTLIPVVEDFIVEQQGRKVGFFTWVNFAMRLAAIYEGWRRQQ